MISDQCRYTETHEWASSQGNTVTAGISDHAIEQLGDIVHLELPAEGDEVTKGTSFGVIESVKAASDLYAPVSGKVKEVNTSLPDNLDLLKEDAYGKAWMIKIEMTDPTEFESLMAPDKYKQFVEQA